MHECIQGVSRALKVLFVFCSGWTSLGGLRGGGKAQEQLSCAPPPGEFDSMAEGWVSERERRGEREREEGGGGSEKKWFACEGE